VSLEYAILGFLQYRPMTGYDLKKIFDASVRHFWPADQSQIYRTLARLEARAHVEQETLRGQEHPDRKVYHITPAGRDALARWLRAPLPAQDTRLAELIQVFFAGQLSDAEAVALFERLADDARASLAVYDQIRRPATADGPADAGMARERFFWQLTLEYGMMSAQADLRWLESVIARMRNGELPAPPAEA
jgi:DNA-binding PadR family transcriptional regulator